MMFLSSGGRLKKFVRVPSIGGAEALKNRKGFRLRLIFTSRRSFGGQSCFSRVPGGYSVAAMVSRSRSYDREDAQLWVLRDEGKGCREREAFTYLLFQVRVISPASF